MPPPEPEDSVEIDDQKDLIDGGTVEPMEDVDFVPRRHRETTASKIAISLVFILAGTSLLHYVAIMVLVVNNQTAAVDELSRFYNAWLPVISGLVGSATTYYFTKDKS